jgi:hypothetical protein
LDGFAIHGSRIQEPTLALVLILHLVDLSEVAAHLVHQLREFLHLSEKGQVLQVPKDFVPVVHGIDVVELRVEERRDEGRFLLHSGNLPHELIQVQVSCE